jgi:hypothetical protein
VGSVCNFSERRKGKEGERLKWRRGRRPQGWNVSTELRGRNYLKNFFISGSTQALPAILEPD